MKTLPIDLKYCPEAAKPRFVTPQKRRTFGVEDAFGGFVYVCTQEQHVVPCMLRDIHTLDQIFSEELRIDSRFSNVQLVPDSHRENHNSKIRNPIIDSCLTSSDFLSVFPINDSGVRSKSRPYYQLSPRMVERLYYLPKPLRTAAIIMGSRIYDSLICDIYGNSGQTTSL